VQLERVGIDFFNVLLDLTRVKALGQVMYFVNPIGLGHIRQRTLGRPFVVPLKVLGIFQDLMKIFYLNNYKGEREKACKRDSFVKIKWYNYIGAK
jgi:hypothetical protein